MNTMNNTINTTTTPRMISVWGCETNPFADGDTCNNGGGYFQPAGGAVWATPVGDVIVDWFDNSCGDFGDRWSAEITVAATGHEWRFSLDCIGGDVDAYQGPPRGGGRPPPLKACTKRQVLTLTRCCSSQAARSDGPRG